MSKSTRGDCEQDWCPNYSGIWKCPDGCEYKRVRGIFIGSVVNAKEIKQ